MSRPTKQRRVCCFPYSLSYYPEAYAGDTVIILTVDEFETIRLIDREGFTQEMCCKQLGVARTTVQKIYDTARKKLADAITTGTPFRVEGGEFGLCPGNSDNCPIKDCQKNKFELPEKEEHTKRLAIAVCGDSVCEDFGGTKQFKLYDVDTQDGKMLRTVTVNLNGSGHALLVRVLTSINADTLICGNIGSGARQALLDANMEIYDNMNGNADTSVEKVLKTEN